jgi:hypothetical protein
VKLKLQTNEAETQTENLNARERDEDPKKKKSCSRSSSNHLHFDHMKFWIIPSDVAQESRIFAFTHISVRLILLCVITVTVIWSSNSKTFCPVSPSSSAFLFCYKRELTSYKKLRSGSITEKNLSLFFVPIFVENLFFFSWCNFAEQPTGRVNRKTRAIFLQ